MYNCVKQSKMINLNLIDYYSELLNDLSMIILSKVINRKASGILNYYKRPLHIVNNYLKDERALVS